MASTILVNTIDTQAGTTITVPTGKTLAITDAGALTIGGTAITTGAQGVLSKTGTYTIVAGDFTGKSSLIVFVNVSAGTSTETIITLPAESAFSTCAMHIISTAVHGAGNYITIKNDTPVEVYTLLAKADHCEIVSDNTTAFRTGNEYCTVRGEVALTANVNMGTNTRSDTFSAATNSNYSVVSDIGSNWSTTTHDFTAPFAGVWGFGGVSAKASGSYIHGWEFVNQTTSKEYNFWVTSNSPAYGQGMKDIGDVELANADVMTFWHTCHSTGAAVMGDSTANAMRSWIHWHLVRRI
jgi:hypothetical protein